MSHRNWRPQPQMTATVRLTGVAAQKLTAWLASQPLPPRTANEALNMALESLQPLPLNENFLVMWRTISDLTAELDEMKARLQVASSVLTEVEKGSRQTELQ
ncbi:hypothetical protein [Acidisoma silvae]|uniref:Uncharacterized protein n=1 Tax=Acidisoma silvae TaxID=2802396 RepID=A0A963YUS8_9PROT|nr:hypothetical protein [Acidisoma silvae]MCB8877423.1 hypothetical protein [Acidisoma silvae]